MICVQPWSHLELPKAMGSLAATSAPVRLVPAPPLYEQGGPVRLVTDFRGGHALAEKEQQAADRGAVVSVVALAPGDRVPEEVVSSMGYRRTCDFYEGSV
jgi:hypothetical protein